MSHFEQLLVGPQGGVPFLGIAPALLKNSSVHFHDRPSQVHRAWSLNYNNGPQFSVLLSSVFGVLASE